VQVKTRVGGAWFQILKLNYDKMFSKISFHTNLRRYAEDEMYGEWNEGDDEEEEEGEEVGNIYTVRPPLL